MSDLPDRWDDEPWPLEDPVPSPSLRPTNWSDTHATVPQVADLADEAWQYAIDRGISMERALAELQDREHYRHQIDQAIVYGSGIRVTFNGIDPGKVASYVPVTQTLIDDMQKAWTSVQQVLSDPSPIVQQFEDWAKQQAGDKALDDVKREPIVPSWQWDTASEEDRP